MTLVRAIHIRMADTNSSLIVFAGLDGLDDAVKVRAFQDQVSVSHLCRVALRSELERRRAEDGRETSDRNNGRGAVLAS